MASGSSGRNSFGSKGFDFGSGDIICSIDDFSSLDASNGRRMDSTINGSSGMICPNLFSVLGRNLPNLAKAANRSLQSSLCSLCNPISAHGFDNHLREDALAVLGKLSSHRQPHFGPPAKQP
ncbi:hypothetical protein MRB53_009618 [Persea americana]|uniref:Uncharacterized protein n=1 Tax=Persea americana TaxID=3435 RepID=A0ACC2LPF1_PERAE|nr:hypothetical protein MRB53_009618 [Persea americana]